MADAYSTGRGFRENLVNHRLAKQTAALQRQVEEEAARTGQPVDYAALEEGFRRIQQASGALQAGMGGEFEAQRKQALGYYDRQAEIGAGRALADDPTNVAGAQQMRGSHYARSGQMDRALPIMESGDRAYVGQQALAAGTGGVPDDMVLARGGAAIPARYGDLQGAQAGNQNYETMKLKRLSTGAGMLLTQLSNPEMYGNEQIAATFNSMAPFLGMGEVQAQETEDGKLHIVRGGKPVAVLDGSEETLAFLKTVARDPASVIPGILEEERKTREGVIAEGKERAEWTRKTIGEVAVKLFDVLGKDGGNAAANKIADSFTRAQASTVKPVGEPITNPTTGRIDLMVQVGGKILRMSRKGGEPGTDPASGEGPAVVYYETIAPGKERIVDPDSVVGGAAAIDYYSALETVHQSAAAQNKMGIFKEVVGLIQAVGSGQPMSGGAPVQTGTPAIGVTPEKFREDVDSLQQQFGFHITDLNRTAAENAKTKGSAKHSQHLDGTAVDIRVHGLGDKKIAEITAAFHARGYTGGYTTRGTAPHLHFQAKRGGAVPRNVGAADTSTAVATTTQAIPTQKVPAEVSGESPVAAALMDPDAARKKAEESLTDQARGLGVMSSQTKQAATQYTRAKAMLEALDSEHGTADVLVGKDSFESPSRVLPEDVQIRREALVELVEESRAKFRALLEQTQSATAGVTRTARKVNRGALKRTARAEAQSGVAFR